MGQGKDKKEKEKKKKKKREEREEEATQRGTILATMELVRRTDLH